MKRKRLQPLALVAVVVAVLITTWWERSGGAAGTQPAQTSTRASAPEREQRRAQSPPFHKDLLDLIPNAEERAQVEATLALIDRGGPFPYPKKDGTVFGNREARLPQQPRGYYREYTVPTPGAKNRGARRIVRGKAGETYYTRDHYGTFVRIR